MPTTPEPLTAEEVGTHLTQRLKAMEAQGHWRNSRMQEVPLEQVVYTVGVAAEEEDE